MTILNWLMTLPLVLFLSQAQASDDYVNALGDSFLRNLPSDWHAEKGGWEYFDVKNCFKNGFCAGSNPTSPYGYPVFYSNVSGSAVSSFQMDRNEAVVIILRTPPQSRYFAFTQYLMKRHDKAIPDFASLSDSLNHKLIGTTGSNMAGVASFNAYSALVWTSNKNTFQQVKTMLMNLSFPESAINLISLPVQIPGYTFSQGYGANGDQFSMLSRIALPTNQAELDNYILENPYFVMKVGPGLDFSFDPVATVGYRNETSNVIESDPNVDLKKSLDLLVADIRKNYFRTYAISEIAPTFSNVIGWECITSRSRNCAGDNHDALYSKDTPTIQVSHEKDMILIVGVNHQKTGKAYYLNHSIYDTVHFAGIAGVADPKLNVDSALFHAGLSPNDPKRLLYQKLYAYAISYDCAGKLHCLKIPAPTDDNPVGLNPKEPFIVAGRKYLEPRTLVRPKLEEIIPHRVFNAKLK